MFGHGVSNALPLPAVCCHAQARAIAEAKLAAEACEFLTSTAGICCGSASLVALQEYELELFKRFIAPERLSPLLLRLRTSG